VNIRAWLKWGAAKPAAGKRTDGSGPRKSADEGPCAGSLGTPAYYEVWAGLESANRALWTALWFAVTAALLALTVARVLAGRPPVVVRMTDAGLAEVSRGGKEPPVGTVEIKNFLTLFERFYTELGVYTYEENLRAAFSMMTQAYQEKADETLKREGVVATLKAEQRRTRLNLTELRVLRETPERLECRIKGYREIGSYGPDATAREEVFEHEVILKKVPRSAKAPYGVLVEDFFESLFKK